jgi:hypothetical protein
VLSTAAVAYCIKALMRTSAMPSHGCNALRDMGVSVAPVLLPAKSQQLLLQSSANAAAAILRTSKGLNAPKSRHVIARIEDAVSLMRSRCQ